MSRNRITLSVLQISSKNLLIQGKATVTYELQEKAELVWLKGNKKREGFGLRSCQLASSHIEKKLVIRIENFMRLQHTWKRWSGAAHSCVRSPLPWVLIWHIPTSPHLQSNYSPGPRHMQGVSRERLGKGQKEGVPLWCQDLTWRGGKFRVHAAATQDHTAAYKAEMSSCKDGVAPVNAVMLTQPS